MNENDAYIFEVEEPREWVFGGNPVWVGGWFLSKTGAVFSDIRAVIDGIPHPGIIGLPRPEIEQRHRGRVGLPHAGFSLLLTPPSGAKTIRLELLDAGHHWVEFWRTDITVHGGLSERPRYRLGLLGDHVHRLLQARRASPDVDLGKLAGELVLEGAAVPTDTLPNPPFFGALEKPELIGGTQYGKVRLEGWIIHREQRIVRLLGSTHPHVENELDYGDRERGEAAQLFPGHPYAGRSAYFGMLDIDETAPGPSVIRMFAELEDGSRHLVFSRRFYMRACNVWEKPLPELSRRHFLNCLSALHRAARTHGVRLGSPREIAQAVRAAWRQYEIGAPADIPAAMHQEPYEAWLQANRIGPRVRELLDAAARRIGADSPTFTLLVDARGCKPGRLTALADSLAAQILPRWEARFLGALAPTGADPRCLSQPGNDFVAALNAAVREATGTHLALIPGDARLSPDALLEIAERLSANPGLELVYTDEDRMDEAGRRSDPDFKPDWSPALALSGLFPGNLAVVRRGRVLELGGYRTEYPAVPGYDLLLRLGDTLSAGQVSHVANVLFHSNASRPRELDLSDPSYEQARQALADAVRRRGWEAAPFLPEAGHHRRLRFHQLRWSPAILARMPVTIVIPTRDRLHLLQECVELLEETIDWKHVRLVIVDDHSRDADAVRYLEQIQQRTDLRCTVVRLADPHAPFNYSRLVNAALPYIGTPLVLHLNNDVNALEPGWLEAMVGWFTQDDVGVVGARLTYPDRTLNHTGIVIGPHGGLADTPFARIPPEQVPVAWHEAAREVSAVTGACLLTRADLYRELGGFDEHDFGVAYNDTDYCLRARAAGRRVIYCPQARLMHWGSATRGVTFDEAEHIAWLGRYPGFRDPYFSPHWRLEGAQLRCHVSAMARTGRVGRLRLLLLTHNLNLEGAPLFLLEYATYLAREQGFGLEVVAGQDGPLRASYEAVGARVTIISPAHLFAARDEASFRRELSALGVKIDWAAVDLVVGNTLLCFWGVPLARAAGKPSVLYIHESTSVFRCFENTLALGLHRFVHESLAEATRAFFLCEATRAYYTDDDRRGNFRIVPSWIHLDAIEQFRAARTRTELRRKHGLQDDALVVANIGTVCERKGQHVFIRAVELFNRQHRGAPVRFLMVGARPGIYLDLLRRDIARLGLANITLIPETHEAFDFFLAADLFVCTSYEESFPRVLMEAMAFRTPIVSTDVHGITDLIGQRQDGYLVRPGDAEGLARMMRTCLAKERSGKSLTPTAHSKVQRGHDSRRILPLHADLAREAWLAALD